MAVTHATNHIKGVCAGTIDGNAPVAKPPLSSPALLSAHAPPPDTLYAASSTPVAAPAHPQLPPHMAYTHTGGGAPLLQPQARPPLMMYPQQVHHVGQVPGAVHIAPGPGQPVFRAAGPQYMQMAAVREAPMPSSQPQGLPTQAAPHVSTPQPGMKAAQAAVAAAQATAACLPHPRPSIHLPTPLMAPVATPAAGPVRTAPSASEPQSSMLQVDIDVPDGYSLVEHIRGPSNAYLQHIENETSVTVQLRGKGAGGKHESSSPLEVWLFHPEPWKRTKAYDLAKSLVDTARQGAISWALAKAVAATAEEDARIQGQEAAATVQTPGESTHTGAHTASAADGALMTSGAASPCGRGEQACAPGGDRVCSQVAGGVAWGLANGMHAQNYRQAQYSQPVQQQLQPQLSAHQNAYPPQLRAAAPPHSQQQVHAEQQQQQQQWRPYQQPQYYQHPGQQQQVAQQVLPQPQNPGASRAYSYAQPGYAPQYSGYGAPSGHAHSSYGGPRPSPYTHMEGPGAHGPGRGGAQIRGGGPQSATQLHQQQLAQGDEAMAAGPAQERSQGQQKRKFREVKEDEGRDLSEVCVLPALAWRRRACLFLLAHSAPMNAPRVCAVPTFGSCMAYPSLHVL
jgi:hypothetical protein